MMAADTRTTRAQARREEARIDAVLSLAQHVHQHSGTEDAGTFTVPSRSEPGVRWTVTVWPNGAGRCTCTAGQHRRACVHLASTLLVLAERRQWSQQRADAPTQAEAIRAAAA